MKELLSFVSGLIVSDRDKLEVREHMDEMDRTNTKFIIKVSKNDTRNIIGREGKTIKAIRSLVSMASINKGIKRKIPVEIVDED
ncbi:MAG TPA: KH domain-containing protein [Candidatus Goldiibacteriota bacterium]|nr:KH domain-containing protein [Candidatus Goldiibacteriota bacterium]